MAITNFDKPVGTEIATLNGNLTPQSVTLTFESGWGNTANTICRKVGKTVFCQIYGDNGTGSTKTTFGSGYPTPEKFVNIPVCDYNGGVITTVWAYVSTTGVLTIRGTGIGVGHSLFGSFSYVTTD